MSGAFVSDGNNLLGNPTGSTGINRDVAGNRIGTSEQPLDPLLGPRADNGGPTFTHDLLKGSPAIDGTNNSGAPVADQRGYVRLTNGVGRVDIGAVEQVVASIQGIKFHDLNANGVQDANEPGLGGFRIFLDLNHNGLRESTEPSTLTAADGNYSFTRLLPGTYDVLEEQRDGYEQTGPLTVQFASSSLTDGGRPGAITTADFNNDGKPDIAVANRLSHDLSIFLNTGLGTFFSPLTVALAGTEVPTGIAAADFDGDDRIDLAVASSVTNTVTFIRNQSNNNWVLGTPLAVGTNPSSIAAGKLDSDSDVDLIVTNGGSNSAIVLFNNGSGVFTVSGTLPFGSGANPSASSLADIDNDHELKLVIANRGTGTLSFFANNGTSSG